MGKKKEKDKYLFRFTCPKCHGTGNYQVGNKFMEADLPCNFKLCEKGIIEIEATSKKKAKEIYSAIEIRLYNDEDFGCN